MTVVHSESTCTRGWWTFGGMRDYVGRAGLFSWGGPGGRRDPGAPLVPEGPAAGGGGDEQPPGAPGGALHQVLLHARGCPGAPDPSLPPPPPPPPWAALPPGCFRLCGGCRGVAVSPALLLTDADVEEVQPETALQCWLCSGCGTCLEARGQGDGAGCCGGRRRAWRRRRG